MIAPDARGPSPLTGLVAVTVLLAVVAGGVVLTQFSGNDAADRRERVRNPPATTSDDGGPAGGTSESQRALAGTRALIAIEQAVRNGRRAQFAQVFTGDDDADVSAADVFTSLRRLPLSTYSLRYVDETSHSGDTWEADVSVQWGLEGLDRRAVTSEIVVTFVDGPDGTQVTEMRPARNEHAPVWLLGRLEAERVGPAMVLSFQRPLTDVVVDQTRTAVRQVRRVLTGWDGSLVVVLPETSEQLEQLLAADSGSYDSIAAVTATADGSGDPNAPVRVLLNPAVFTGLGPIAGQVVLSHEATHAATGATFRDMPLWLVEGFGDYVALSRDPVPLRVAAGQVIEQVRESGPPEQLPGEEEFSTEAHGLGASYEAAWLACRLIAEEYGEDRLLRFHRVVARTGDVDAAFERVLDTTEEEFTERWRDHLAELAA